MPFSTGTKISQWCLQVGCIKPSGFFCYSMSKRALSEKELNYQANVSEDDDRDKDYEFSKSGEDGKISEDDG